MHWATAKPARQGGDVTRREGQAAWREGCHLPGDGVCGPLGKLPPRRLGWRPPREGGGKRHKAGSFGVWLCSPLSAELAGPGTDLDTLRSYFKGKGAAAIAGVRGAWGRAEP